MLIIVLCAVALGQVALELEAQVTTSQGTMKGQVLKSRDGRDFFSFTRIPYAKPPIGERRFMISEKADNWTGIWDATQPIPLCHQPNSLFIPTGTLGQEDCLYLNVFTPNLTGRLPVIFGIHGGGYKIGSAADLGSAKYFMDEDVVFVAPNYRLGTLGFLSLEDNVIPGNMGLKDQALALEWVQKEIRGFGGDPNLITVIGESAGGASSNIICEAPRTNGLIKGCVSQSGDGWATWVFLKSGTARKLALNFANAVGCNETDILKCLQGKPIELVGDIALLQDNITRITNIFPVLEPANVPGALVTSWPTSPNHNFPWIVGVCQDEGMIYTLLYEYPIKTQKEKEDFINGFNQTIITELHLENRNSDLVRARERFFTKGLDPILAIRNFMTELMFVYPTLKGLSRHPGPTYFYKFNYTKGPTTPYHTDHPGVTHGSEMPFLYEPMYKPSTDWPQPEQVKLSKLLVKMWANFARDQNPSTQDTMQWSQFQGQYFLDIQDSGVTMGDSKQYQEILDFWKSMFPEQSSSSSTIKSSIIFIAAFCIFTSYKGLFL